MSVTRAPWTVRVATWSARHRWLVAALWFGATVGMFALSLAIGGTRAVERGLEQRRAVALRIAPRLRRLQRLRHRGSDAAIPARPLRRDRRRSTTPPVRTAIDETVADLVALRATVDGADVAVFEQVLHPLEVPPAAGLVSPDRTTVQIVGRIAGEGATLEQKVGPIPATLEELRARHPGMRDPCAEQHARQQRDQRARQRRSRRVAAAHDPPDVPDPARRVRDRGRGGGAARPRDHGPARGVRPARHLQPGRRSGQPVCEPAGRAHRPRGRGRLLAVHAHPLPDGTSARPRQPRSDRGRELDRRPGRVLLRARGHDLDRGPVHARRPALPVDGARHDRRRPHLGHRLAHVPAGRHSRSSGRRRASPDPVRRPAAGGGQRALGEDRAGSHAPAGHLRRSPPAPFSSRSPCPSRACTWARATSRRSRTRSTACRRSTS